MCGDAPIPPWFGGWTDDCILSGSRWETLTSENGDTIPHAGFLGGSAGKESALCWENPLEKGTATHSSILAWRSPWTV